MEPSSDPPSPSPTGPPLAARPALGGSSGAGARRVVSLAVLALLSVYTVRLARQFAVAQRAEADRARLAASVGAIETEIAALQTETAFAHSDAYVERWAREDQRWVRAGDQPVKVVPATPGPAAAATPAAPGVLDRLLDWLRR